MRTLDEFRQQAPERSTRTSQIAHLRPLAQVAPRIEALTGDPTWDYFLAYLEAAATAARRHLEFEFVKLRDPMMVNGDEIAKCKAKITAIEARLETLSEVMALPKLLREQSERAHELIAQMERDVAPISR